MEVTYKSRHIHSVPELNLKRIPGFLTLMCLGRVAPNAINCLPAPLAISRPSMRPKPPVEMAKTWIDAESADDLTP